MAKINGKIFATKSCQYYQNVFTSEKHAPNRLVLRSQCAVKQRNKSEGLPLLQEILTPLLYQKTAAELGFQLIRSGTHCFRHIFSHNVKHGRLSS